MVLDESQAAALDAMSGERASGLMRQGQQTQASDNDSMSGPNQARQIRNDTYGDTGGASRFYFTAKAPGSERVKLPKVGAGNGTQNYGGYKVRRCDECGRRSPATGPLECGHESFTWSEPLDRKPGMVSHPTVKPLDLMRWLVRLVTPPNGVVLEPFAGSGTTVEACLLEGFRCVAIEREPDYLPLIMQRIHRRIDPVAAVRATQHDGGLFDLLDEDTA